MAISAPLHLWGNTFGDAEYGTAYEAVKNYPLEKYQSSMIVAALISALQGNGGISLTEGTPLAVLDVGTYDGKTIRQIVERIDNGDGAVAIHAVDREESSVAAVRKTFAGMPDVTVQVITADAFSGALGNQLSGMEMDVAFASHLAYGTKEDDIKTLVEELATGILKSTGVGILLHIQGGEDSLVDLKNTYGGNNASGYDGPPVIIQNIIESAGDNRLHAEQLTFRTGMYFDPMTDAEWEMIKDPANFSRLQSKPHITDNVLRMSFVAWRTPQEMAEAGEWAEFVDRMKQVVQKDINREPPFQDGGSLGDDITVQVLLPARERAADGFADKVQQAVEAVKEQLPSINAKAQQEMEARISLEKA